eukprot:9797274-Karenia_brevis.AAC.1
MRIHDGPLARDVQSPVGFLVPDMPSDPVVPGSLRGLCPICQETSSIIPHPATPCVVPCGSLKGIFMPYPIGHQPCGCGVT